MKSIRRTERKMVEEEEWEEHNRENKNQRVLLLSCLPHSISPLAVGRKNEGESSVNPLSYTSESSLRHNLVLP